ncbi:IS3 family transposase [Paenibacillus rhizoplanae]|uniref:IS3 family transposase n=1 Tax=Paenibacillus rhizoplanae TaxID=1917181 RepID=UPI0036150F58
MHRLSVKRPCRSESATIFNDHKGRYGSPKITRLLHQEGYTLTERTVSVYMRQNEAPLGGL